MKTFFNFLYVELQKQRYKLIFLITLSNEKSLFADNLRAEPVIFSMEKIKFSLKLLSDHFYGQSFIKTVGSPSSNAVVGVD